jgi:hypothetical protein
MYCTWQESRRSLFGPHGTIVYDYSVTCSRYNDNGQFLSGHTMSVLCEDGSVDNRKPYNEARQRLLTYMDDEGIAYALQGTSVSETLY